MDPSEVKHFPKVDHTPAELDEPARLLLAAAICLSGAVGFKGSAKTKKAIASRARLRRYLIRVSGSELRRTRATRACVMPLHTQRESSAGTTSAVARRRKSSPSSARWRSGCELPQFFDTEVSP